MKSDFFLFRIIKKFFFTGLVNILPTILVVSIIVIAYNFLEKNLGSPINALIKNQLTTNWKYVAINYLDIDETLFEPIKIETYEDLVRRVQKSSPDFFQAKTALDKSRKTFENEATELIQKKESSNDEEYITFLEGKIQSLRETTGLLAAEENFKRANRFLRNEIDRENDLRLTKEKWGSDRPLKLKQEIGQKYPDWIGLLIAIAIIFIIGIIITTVAGNSIKKLWERTLERVPLVRRIYPYTKQLTEFLVSEKKRPDFKSVVLIEYPRKGIYTLGFPTGRVTTHISDKDNLISVFIPSSPTPFTGYTIIISESEATELPISVEEAVRYCITGGVIKPENMGTTPEIVSKTKKERNDLNA